MDNTKLLKKISLYSMKGDENEWGMNINKFDWNPGVGLYGIYQAYRKTGDKELLDFLIAWTEQYLDDAYVNKTINSTCPLLTVIELYEITKNEKYLATCKDIAEYLVNDAPITREGGLEHTVTESGSFSEQIWADTLFMAVLFLAKMSKYDKKYADFAIKQLQVHIQCLFDEKRNLFCHGWNCAAKNHMSAVCWARANAWITYSSITLIEILGKFEGYETILEYIDKQVAAIAKVQAPNGGFCTVLDDPTSYCEASATGGIVAGIKKGIDLGLLSETYMDICRKGTEYIKSVVREDGLVDEVSTGTPVMKDAEGYKKIHICPCLYGQALATLALCME